MTLTEDEDWMHPHLKSLLLSGTILYALLLDKRFKDALVMYDTMCMFVSSGGKITKLVRWP